MRNSAQTIALILALASAGCAAGTGTAPGIPHANDALAQPGERAAALWIPTAGSTYAIQYGGPRLKTSVPAGIYDVDGFDTSRATVQSLHSNGRHAVCYMDIGTWENWRPDAGQFPASVLGNKDGGWHGERWLDIRQPIVRTLMAKRFQICKDKGFDAVDPDNIDGYANPTGFQITAAEQLSYDTWAAGAIHALGLSVAQKNDGAQIRELSSVFDFAVLEQCYAQRWCGTFAGYTARNRLVVDIEYGMKPSRFTGNACPVAARYHETALLKHLSLDAWVVTCRAADSPN